MWRIFKREIFTLGSALALSFVPAIFVPAICVSAIFVSAICVPELAAQQTKEPPALAGPVPAQINSAKSAFISNAGGESFETVLNATVFTGGPDRSYNQFYAAMKNWGRYELVTAPADADLVFEMSWALTDTGLKLPVLGQLRVVILDPKTHATLWAFTEHVRGAILQGNRDKNFDQAMDSVMARVKGVAGRAAAAAGGR